MIKKKTTNKRRARLVRATLKVELKVSTWVLKNDQVSLPQVIHWVEILSGYLHSLSTINAILNANSHGRTTRILWLGQGDGVDSKHGKTA